MLILLVVSQQYMKRICGSTNTILEKFGLLFCTGIVWAFAALLTVSGAYNNVGEETKLSCRTDHSNLISSAPWIKIPYPFQYGAPIFKASHIFGMMGAAFVSSAEATGTYFAAARYSGATPPPAHVLSRSVGLQGIGMLLDGLFGAVVGTDASVENVGLLGLTRVGNRRVVQISSAFMIFFSIFGKFGAFFASIPFPIFAAMYCVLFGNISATGISYTQFTNNNSPRNLYILGLSLFLGISIPQYFDDSAGRGQVRTAGRWFNDILNTIFSSHTTVVTTVGTILDNTLDTRGMDKDRGMPWWVQFQNNRRNEFYNFPGISIHINSRPPPPPSPPSQPPPPPPPPPPSQPPPDDKDNSDDQKTPVTEHCPGIIPHDPCAEDCPRIIIIHEQYDEDYPPTFPRDYCVVM